MGGLCMLVVFMLLVFHFDAFWYILFELPQDLSQQQSGDICRSLVFYRRIENEVQNSKARGAFELIKDDGADALKKPAGRRYDFPAPAETMSLARAMLFLKYLSLSK
jgi:hypothetical protein